jgi:hypothetical protein
MLLAPVYLEGLKAAHFNDLVTMPDNERIALMLSDRKIIKHGSKSFYFVRKSQNCYQNEAQKQCV